MQLIMLPMFRVINPLRVVLQGEDEAKLQYLTSIMTASKFLASPHMPNGYRFFFIKDRGAITS